MSRQVSAKVIGQFPGSPAIINFVFRLSCDQITSLDITA